MDAIDCAICGETLTDPESVKRRVGPVCAAKQTKSLAAAGSSAEEVAALSMLGDATVSAWLRKLAGAIAAGRSAHAELFLAAARKAAAIARAEVEAKAA